MESDLVGLGRTVAATLLRPDVDDRRAGQAQGAPQRLEQRVEVVAGHDADVGDPEILEQLPGLGEVDDRLAQPPAELEHGPADERDPFDRRVVRALALLPGVRELDLAQVLGERADRGADRHLVVVDHDQHLRLALADVVEGLERQSAHQCGIADDHRDPLQPMSDVARLREPLGDGQARARVAAVEHVVRRLRPSREPADPVQLAERAESFETTGEQLVRVGLMARVPHDVIAWRSGGPRGDRRRLRTARS